MQHVLFGPRLRARFNVSLGVGPLREDGYHSVASVYLAVSLYEEVAATSTATPGSRSASPRPAPWTSTTLIFPSTSGTLPTRLLRSWPMCSQRPAGVRLGITQRVPVAGGMGPHASRNGHPLGDFQVAHRRECSDTSAMIAGSSCRQGSARPGECPRRPAPPCWPGRRCTVIPGVCRTGGGYFFIEGNSRR